MQINSQATKIKLIWMINWVELDELQINPILKIKVQPNPTIHKNEPKVSGWFWIAWVGCLLNARGSGQETGRAENCRPLK